MTGPGTSEVAITDLNAMELQRTVGQSLVRVETDAGIVGYGEAGADGPTVRAQLRLLEDDLLGEDPLEIERHYDRMTNRQHTYRPHVPTVSGVDIALWDIAGKLLDRPVSTLLTGRFRERVPLYVNDRPDDLLDAESCREWAAGLDERPYSTVKVSFDSVLERTSPDRDHETGRKSPTLENSELAAVREAAENVREALGWDADFVTHCHNEWDLPSAIGMAEAVGPAEPLWIEDPLPVEFSENWKTLRDDAPCRVLTGEKLELPREFRPFLDAAAVDAIQPDLAFAGGVTGCRRIAELADQHHVPVTAHNVGSLVQNAATAHFGASVRNFWTTETRYPQVDLFAEMGDAPGMDVADGGLGVPDGPGLGVTLDEDVLRANRAEGEPYWD
jgi:L-alanine-DL-glutamate epimerase-like enolase superfamily enzyme